jgi:hypothetical protein
MREVFASINYVINKLEEKNLFNKECKKKSLENLNINKVKYKQLMNKNNKLLIELIKNCNPGLVNMF